jgi:hypothetical protein
MRCEASGPMYGLEEGIRCSVSLSAGVDFDHFIADALGGDNSLENCIAACIRCHRWKTSHNDVPKAAKVKRVSDKSLGIKAPKQKIASAGFAKRQREKPPLTKVVPRGTGLYQERSE